jgi:hypothetical protein
MRYYELIERECVASADALADISIYKNRRNSWEAILCERA